MSVATIVEWDTLGSVKPEIVEWDEGEFFSKRNMKRATLDPIIFKTPELEVRFGCKVSKYNDTKFDVAINIPNDKYYEIINGPLKQHFIDLVKSNSKKTGYDDDEEIIEEFFKSAFSETEKYGILFNGKIEENKYKGISFDDILIDENDKPIKSPDFIKELVKGTTVIMILEIPHIDFYKTEYRPGFKIMKIKIVKKAEPYIKTYINKNTYKTDHIEILAKETNESGGTFSKIKYNFGAYSAQVPIEFNDVKLAPFPFINKDKVTGNDYYGISVTVEDEDEKGFIELLDKDIIKQVGSKSKELFGGKKPQSLKTIEAKYNGILKYSKDDKVLVKAGESSKYPPRVDIAVPKYEDKTTNVKTFTFKYFDKDLNEQDPENFSEFKLANNDTRYNIKCHIRWVWYGKELSIKLILNEIQVLSSIGPTKSKYTFGTEIQEETNTVEATATTEATTDTTSDDEEDDEPENSDSDEESSGDDSD